MERYRHLDARVDWGLFFVAAALTASLTLLVPIASLVVEGMGVGH